MDFSYKFPVVRGRQANREYYIAMVPLRMLGKLFPVDDEYVLPEHRAQRKLNAARVPVISNYIVENRETYVFSALAASIDGEFVFNASSEHADLGVLEVSMDAKFLINDGQHRKAAIMEAVREDPSLLNETIPVVFFADQGLKRSQQMFTDLNKHAVKTSNSIAELYDSRDPLAVVTRRVISAVPFLDDYTDKEKDILGKFSSCLFTLNTFYNANKRILRSVDLNYESECFLIDYWTQVVEHIVPWNELVRREISKVDLRENYIVTQAVIIQVFGRLGNYFITHPEVEMSEKLKLLEGIDWKRNSSVWVNRTIKENGRMINNETAIVLTCNVLKEWLDIPLDQNELSKEKGMRK